MVRFCLFCKKEFNVSPCKLKAGRGKYCSCKCYLASIKRTEVICKSCEKLFLVSNNRILDGRGKYCSKICQYKPKKVTMVKCRYCDKSFIVKISELNRGGGIYCSRYCVGKGHKKRYSGEKASNWKGGKQRERHNGDYRYSDWRLKIYEKDRFVCQGCNMKGGKLNAHHILSWAEFPSLRYELWNGVTLCEQCHKKEHTKTKQEVKNGNTKKR